MGQFALYISSGEKILVIVHKMFSQSTEIIAGFLTSAGFLMFSGSKLGFFSTVDNFGKLFITNLTPLKLSHNN